MKHLNSPFNNNKEIYQLWIKEEMFVLFYSFFPFLPNLPGLYTPICTKKGLKCHFYVCLGSGKSSDFPEERSETTHTSNNSSLTCCHTKMLSHHQEHTKRVAEAGIYFFLPHCIVVLPCTLLIHTR